MNASPATCLPMPARSAFRPLALGLAALVAALALAPAARAVEGAGPTPAGETAPSAKPPGSKPAVAKSGGAPPAGSARASREVLIPAGTLVTLVTQDAISSESSRVGDPFRLTVAEAVRVDGTRLLKEGAMAEGRVTIARPRGRLARQGRLGIALEHLEVAGQKVEVRVVTPGEDPAASRTRRALGRITNPVKRMTQRLVESTDVAEPAREAAAAFNEFSEGRAQGFAERALAAGDPLADVEVTNAQGGSLARLVGHGVRGLERVGTGYVMTVWSGPSGLLGKGVGIEVPSGTRVQVAVLHDVTVQP